MYCLHSRFARSVGVARRGEKSRAVRSTRHRGQNQIAVGGENMPWQHEAYVKSDDSIAHHRHTQSVKAPKIVAAGRGHDPRAALCLPVGRR